VAFYEAAPDNIKRMLLQAVFEKIWIIDEQVVGVDLTRPLAEVLSGQGFKHRLSGRSKIGVVGLRGFKLNPAVLKYFTGKPPSKPARRRSRRQERRVSKRLDAERIERLVADYAAGTSIAKSSVVQLVREAGERVRHPRLSTTETAQLVALYEAGLSQVDIAEQLGRSPSAVWHVLRRMGLIRN
jgi:Helix-turn-helix domain